MTLSNKRNLQTELDKITKDFCTCGAKQDLIDGGGNCTESCLRTRLNEDITSLVIKLLRESQLVHKMGGELADKNIKKIFTHAMEMGYNQAVQEQKEKITSILGEK